MGIHDTLDDVAATVIYNILDLKKVHDDLHDELLEIDEFFDMGEIWAQRYLHEIRVELIHSLLTIPVLRSNFSRQDLARYFINHCGMSREMSKKLANRVCNLNKKWGKRRKTVTMHEDLLWRMQNGTCNHCHHLLVRNSEEDLALKTPDLFRPYYWKEHRKELFPEVDHIEPTSLFGTNALENLQLLCYACNQGKKQGLFANYFSALRNYGEEFHVLKKPTIEVVKLIRPLVYYRIEVDERRCTMCGLGDKPLTIRTQRPEAVPTISNTRTFCYDCLQ